MTWWGAPRHIKQRQGTKIPSSILHCWDPSYRARVIEFSSIRMTFSILSLSLPSFSSPCLLALLYLFQKLLAHWRELLDWGWTKDLFGLHVWEWLPTIRSCNKIWKDMAMKWVMQQRFGKTWWWRWGLEKKRWKQWLGEILRSTKGTQTTQRVFSMVVAPLSLLDLTSPSALSPLVTHAVNHNLSSQIQMVNPKTIRTYCWNYNFCSNRLWISHVVKTFDRFSLNMWLLNPFLVIFDWGDFV